MPRAPAVPVLTYHAIRVEGSTYASNDHLALAADLERLHALGVRVVPVREVAGALVEGALARLNGTVAISFDDGADFDFHDLPHPRWGPQRSMLNVLRDFRARHGAAAQPQLHATSFVIVSPEARRELDERSLIGCRWWNDDWWADAEATELMAVESHSWDHNHDRLSHTATSAARGGFKIASRDEAEREIAAASRYLCARRRRGAPVLFASPYGDESAFLTEEYFPDTEAGHHVFAAFTTAGAPVTPGLSRWSLPRFVCGWHWKSTDELERLLIECAAVRGAGFWSRLLARRARPAQGAAPAPAQPAAIAWRDCLKTWEIDDARAVAGALFRRSFGHEIPDYRRHFVLVYSPAPGLEEDAPRVVAYVHHTPFEDVHLCGGMCADAAAYRRFPRPLFEQVRDAGGLATIVTRDSIAQLGDGAAIFGHVGEPRARAADLRTGFVDTDSPHLMVIWRRTLPDEEKRRLVDRVEALGPF
jgi:peptidoglycan/xylan/chitin deacetylase (PgdA/CDA1 family)